MRLIIKTTLLYLALAVVVFCIGGIVTYQMVNKEVALETDYELKYHFKSLLHSIREGHPIDPFRNDKIAIKEINTAFPIDTTVIFSDTIAMHPRLKRLEPHRKLTAVRQVNGQFYRFSMFEVIIEDDDVYEGVISVLTRLFLFLSLILLVCSFLLSNWLFKPFQVILQKINSFNLKSNQPLNLPDTSIKEFQQLNSFVQQMTDKVRRDYLTLKEFSENASHEMQTPIAVAKGKLELLLESPSLKPKDLFLVQEAQDALNKLSKLGQALTLLTKIENKEFISSEKINFSAKVEKVLSTFKELAEMQGYDVISTIDQEVEIKMDSGLADIMVSNLFKNAIQHNIKNGWIKVELAAEKLVVTNSGGPLQIPPAQLFDRFKKGSGNGQSLGLGLAIVKRICEVNDCTTSYEYVEGVHQISINFPGGIKNQNSFKIHSNSN